MARPDDFAGRRAHLVPLSDEELEARFWELTGQIVAPLINLARTHTSPSIERSVLMRMGFDSPTCASIVHECERRGLLGHGAGHVVLGCAGVWGTGVLEAGRRLATGNGWDTAEGLWETGHE
jgi:D-ornithine 4,5-aminomutase subunit alpha